MKALKTVAVALGITLAALIVIPLDRAGRPVRLAEADRRGRRGDPRARPRRRLIDSESSGGWRRGASPPTSEIESRFPAEGAGSLMSAASAASTRADRRLAEIAVLVVMVIWAGNFIVVKSALAVLPPVGFTFLRFVLASVTLLVLLRWREGSIGLPRRDLIAMWILGGLGFGLYQILWTTGLTTVAAGDSALIIAATPVLVALLAVVARSDVLTPVKLAGRPRLVRRRGDRHRVRARALDRRLDRRRGDHAWPPRSAGRSTRRSPRRTCGASRRCGRRPGRPSPGPPSSRPVAILQLGTVDLGAPGPRSPVRSSTRGCWRPGISNVVVLNGIKVVGPTRTAALQFLVPGARRRPGGHLPRRADPAGPGDRRSGDRCRGRPDAERFRRRRFAAFSFADLNVSTGRHTHWW